MATQVIAIDGPAGSGKSTASRRVATELGFGYLDTGAIYRALGLWLQVNGILLNNFNTIEPLLPEFEAELSLNGDPADPVIAINGRDYSVLIREPDASQAASSIAQLPEVRAFLVGLFRRKIREYPGDGIVVEGRDITTVVAPEANLRLLLTADEVTRMRRRGLEAQSGTELSKEITERDQADSRMVDFFNAAPGVSVLDTTELSLDEVVSEIVERYRATEGV